MNYQVTYEFKDPELGLQVRTRTFEAVNAGQAFYKCAKRFPGCKLIRSVVTGGPPRSVLTLETFPPENPRLDTPLMETDEFKQDEFNLGILGKNSGRKRGS